MPNVSYSHPLYESHAINKKLNIHVDLFLRKFVIDHDNIMHNCTSTSAYSEKVGVFHSPPKVREERRSMDYLSILFSSSRL